MKKELVIFDMDGVLIDSEPYWNLAIRKGFRSVGLEMSDEMCEETMGARLNEVVDYRVHKHDIDPAKSQSIEDEILDEIIRYVIEEAAVLPGVKELISKLREKDIPFAIASSSPHRLIEAVMQKLGEADAFKAVFSAQDDLYGKPNPAVYIRCAETLGFKAEQCLVIEDSVNGMVAAKAAKMDCVVVPEEKMRSDKRYNLADHQIDSLLDFEMSFLN